MRLHTIPEISAAARRRRFAERRLIIAWGGALYNKRADNLGDTRDAEAIFAKARNCVFLEHDWRSGDRADSRGMLCWTGLTN